MPIGRDLADERLRGEVEAARFVEGRPARIGVAVAESASAPRPDGGLSTQALYGDEIRVFDVAEGWAWIQIERDGYVGYVADTVLAERGTAPTHVVTVPRTFVYPGPDLKLPHDRRACPWARASPSREAPRRAARNTRCSPRARR